VLGIRRETDYAVRTILHLASVGERTNVQVRDVAAQRRLPLSFVRRIVARLSAAGLLETTRGTGGGIRLARPAAEISMLDVVQAMEGPVALNPCVVAPHTCPLAMACPAQRAWAEATAVLETHLASVRFDRLAEGAHGHLSAHRVLTVSAAPPKRPKALGQPTLAARRKAASG
jgi:Rrf2 family protein